MKVRFAATAALVLALIGGCDGTIEGHLAAVDPQGASNANPSSGAGTSSAGTSAGIAQNPGANAGGSTGAMASSGGSGGVSAGLGGSAGTTTDGSAGVVLGGGGPASDDGGSGGDDGSSGPDSTSGSGGSGNGGGSGSNGGSGNSGGSGNTGSGGGGAEPDAYQACVDRINAFRATKGLPALARRTDKEPCADGQAKSDSETGTAHGAFNTCDDWAQNECPGWGSVDDVIQNCLQAMWNEGPGGGHYENMISDRTYVWCGFYTTPAGKVWSVQDFK